MKGSHGSFYPAAEEKAFRHLSGFKGMEIVAHLAVYKTLPLTGLRLSDNLQKHVDGDLLERTL